MFEAQWHEHFATHVSGHTIKLTSYALDVQLHVHICVCLEKNIKAIYGKIFTNQLLFRALKKPHIFCLGAFLIKKKRPFLSNTTWTRVTTGAIASAHLVHDLANMTS